MKCKSRRVKCDEKRPVCGNCGRLKMDCLWPDTPGRTTRSQQSLRASPNPSAQDLSPSTLSAESATTHHSPTQEQTNAAASYMSQWPRWPSEGGNPFGQVEETGSQRINLPETKSRRLMEHRLMQNWYSTVCNPTSASSSGDWRRLWTTTMPALSLKYDNVMYGLLATSATSLLRASASGDGDRDQISTAAQSYFTLALNAQRQEVAELSVSNAQPVCFGALLISICSFAMLKDRVLEPYTPPLEWLRLGRGAGTIIWQSVETIVTQEKQTDHPALMTIATSYPYFGKDQSYFAPSMRASFGGVLTQHLPSRGDDWDDDDTREAYEKTLSYVGSIQKGINEGEPVYALTRRIQTFALLVPPLFVEFLSVQRPRALVILAHFWATVAQVDAGIWWLGRADAVVEESMAKREIRAIKKALPAEWMTTMVWPLDQVGLRDWPLL